MLVRIFAEHIYKKICSVLLCLRLKKISVPIGIIITLSQSQNLMCMQELHASPDSHSPKTQTEPLDQNTKDLCLLLTSKELWGAQRLSTLNAADLKEVEAARSQTIKRVNELIEEGANIVQALRLANPTFEQYQAKTQSANSIKQQDEQHKNFYRASFDRGPAVWIFYLNTHKLSTQTLEIIIPLLESEILPRINPPKSTFVFSCEKKQDWLNQLLRKATQEKDSLKTAVALQYGAESSDGYRSAASLLGSAVLQASQSQEFKKSGDKAITPDSAEGDRGT